MRNPVLLAARGGVVQGEQPGIRVSFHPPGTWAATSGVQASAFRDPGWGPEAPGSRRLDPPIPSGAPPGWMALNRPLGHQTGLGALALRGRQFATAIPAEMQTNSIIGARKRPDA